MRRSSQDGGSREAAKRLVRRALAPLLGVSALHIFEMVFSSLGGVREKQLPTAQQTARVSLARQAHRTCGSKEASGGYDCLFGWNPLQCSQKKYYSCRYIFIVTIKHFFIYVYMESRLPQVNT